MDTHLEQQRDGNSDTDNDMLSSDSYTPTAADELMSVLDAMEGHADDSIAAHHDTEIQWIQILNERDELILSNKESIEDLQKLNENLTKENEQLKQQLVTLDQSEVVQALQEDAGSSRGMSLQVSSLWIINLW